jgi:hypothetical protein
MTLDKLRAIAEAATPGPWTKVERLMPRGGTALHVVDREDIIVANAKPGNAAFIATFSPPTVLALMDVVEAASVGHWFPGHDCLPFQVTDGTGRTYCDLCEALARLEEL